jgi:glucosamine--fructose-6-phosphate aminotransferase (isomerizing)
VFGKYLLESRLGLVVAAAAPSIGTLYPAVPPKLSGALFIAVSQSGRSPDLLAKTAAAAAAGARTLAIVNDEASPLARLCHWILPLQAGPELSVAATKSYLGSLAALIHLSAEWSGDTVLRNALDRLPERMARAAGLEWEAAVEALTPAGDMLVVGRGVGFALAKEMALKLKETCGLHAESFSSAEIMHGPLALVGPDYPVLAVRLGDEAESTLAELVSTLRAMGARALVAGEPGGLPVLPPDHSVCDAVTIGQSFYGCVDRLAARRGRDVDRPPHLLKVTKTR